MSGSQRQAILLGVGAMVLLAAVAVGARVSQSTVSLQTTRTAGASRPPATTPGPGQYQLIAAQHPQCEQLGQQVATYLDTGEPATMDANLSGDRITVLNDRRAGEADDAMVWVRYVADLNVTRCEQQFAAQEQQAEAQAEQEREQEQQAEVAQQQAEAQQQAAEELAREYQAGCAKAGGKVASAQAMGKIGADNLCWVNYGDGPVQVTLDRGGSLDPQMAALNRQECATLPRGVQRTYHTESGICYVPQSQFKRSS